MTSDPEDEAVLRSVVEQLAAELARVEEAGAELREVAVTREELEVRLRTLLLLCVFTLVVVLFAGFVSWVLVVEGQEARAPTTTTVPTVRS